MSDETINDAESDQGELTILDLMQSVAEGKTSPNMAAFVVDMLIETGLPIDAILDAAKEGMEVVAKKGERVTDDTQQTLLIEL